MEAQSEDYAAQNKYLRRCINDLVSILALPALWTGNDPLHIVQTSADTLVSMLDLDFVYVTLNDPGSEPLEFVRFVNLQTSAAQSQKLCALLGPWIGNDPQMWPRTIANYAAGGELVIVPLRLGLHGEIGSIVVGVQRADFPDQAEKLVLGMAANQASIGLQESRLLSEQKRLASELDGRVAQRTVELAGVNKELRKEIAARKKIEERLLESEAFLLEAQRLSHTGSWKHDFVSGKVSISPEMARIFEIRPGQGTASAEFFFSRIHPEDEPGEVAEYANAIREKRGFDSDYRIQLPDGAVKHIHNTGHPKLNPSGELIGFVGTAIDVTKQHHAEEALKRSEAFLAEGQYLSRTGSFSWRVRADEITWSDQLCRIFEFEEGTPVTLERIGRRFHPEDAAVLSEMINRVREGAADLEYEHRLLLPDHSVKYLHLIAHAGRDQEGELEYIGAVQDVTQRRTSEEALAKARSELAKVARVTSLGVLTASMAHEVNQPLSGIMTNASTCLRMLSAKPPNVEGARETVRRTIRDGNRASDVITRLRTLYSKKEPLLEWMDLNEATREVISLSLSELQRNRVVLRQELADDMPPLMGDRIQLQQVILNLLRNASDAMSAIEDRPRELLVRTERHDDDRECLSVKDTGTGFEPQTADKLFQAFFTTKDDGMGIGLSISRSIIEAHQGRLWATPNDGAGATFSFVIPCHPEI